MNFLKQAAIAFLMLCVVNQSSSMMKISSRMAATFRQIAWPSLPTSKVAASARLARPITTRSIMHSRIPLFRSSTAKIGAFGCMLAGSLALANAKPARAETIYKNTENVGSIKSTDIHAPDQLTLESFPGLQKINDELYVGKVSDSCYLAMERIDRKNIDMWYQYANNQANPRGITSKYLFNRDGAYHFSLVLRDYKNGVIDSSHELWIAYASNKPIIDKARLDARRGDHIPYNPHIEMYVTVISSSKAIISSNMGISRTWEAAEDLTQTPPKRSKQPDQSVHLHSFSAKVMKIIDPNKVYMITAPVEAMRNILMNKMPDNSLFIGDDMYQKELEEAEKNRLSLLYEPELRYPNKKGETPEQRETKLKLEADRAYNRYKVNEKISLLKSHPPRIKINDTSAKKKQFTIIKPDGSSISFDESNPEYTWMFTKAYSSLGSDIPYVAIDLSKLASICPLKTEESQ